MRAFSRVVRNTPPLATIRWSKDTAVEVDGHLVPLNEYKSYIQSSIKELENLVQTKVLCNISLATIGISTIITEDTDAGSTVPYHGPFSHEMSELLDNPDSDKFANAMVSQKRLGLNVKVLENGQTSFMGDTKKVWSWLATVDEAWELLYCLYHITSGLPGRGTEESMLQWTNSSTSRRHLFTIDGAIRITSNYHKGTALTGTYKTITRLVLPQLSIIFLILLRVVRPLQLTLHLQFGRQPRQGKTVDRLSSGDIENYRTKIFIKNGRTLSSKDQSKALCDWFSLHCEISVGIRWYRQFATALQRKWIHELAKDPEFRAMAFADEQAGHTQNTSEGHYARAVGSSGDSESRIKLFCDISRLWQRKLGLIE